VAKRGNRSKALRSHNYTVPQFNVPLGIPITQLHDSTVQLAPPSLPRNAERPLYLIKCTSITQLHSSTIQRSSWHPCQELRKRLNIRSKALRLHNYTIPQFNLLLHPCQELRKRLNIRSKALQLHNYAVPRFHDSTRHVPSEP